LLTVEARADPLLFEVLDEADVVAAGAADAVLPRPRSLAEVEDLGVLGDQLVHGPVDLGLEARGFAAAIVARGNVAEAAARRGRRRRLRGRRRGGGRRGGRRGRLLAAADGERRGRDDRGQRGNQGTGTQLHPYLQQAGRTRRPRKPGRVALPRGPAPGKMFAGTNVCTRWGGFTSRGA